jgi:hypothetical protein
MAIFGDLADLPFAEIFNIVGRRTGKLVLWDLPGQTYFEIHLQDGALRGLRVGLEPVEDPFRVRARLSTLLEETSGRFEFRLARPEELFGSLALSIPGLLMSMAAAVDEIGAYRHRFPHPGTRFRCLAGEKIRLDQELFVFLQRATPWLEAGASAEELARFLGVGLDQVQLHLYKLRAVGQIAPVRAFEETPAPAVPTAAAPAWPLEDRELPFAAAIDLPFAALRPPSPPAKAEPAIAAPKRSPAPVLVTRLLRTLRQLVTAS